eukprot:m.211242 g.211242  ORF g.211242 m.211242 type:complete len:208 (-) comp13785_c1_seq25:1375-1998(-)
MHIGFPMLEAGSVSSKAVANILFKNFTTLVFSTLGFFVSGYAFAFGGEFDEEGSKNSILGTKNFFLMDINACELPFFVFQLSFATTVATIMSGSLASRPTILATGIYSFLIVAFIYPLVAHWSWTSNGFLFTGTNGVGFIDFAGAGVVHVVGGVSGLMGCIVLGPRSFRLSSKSFKSVPVRATSLNFFLCHFTSCLCGYSPSNQNSD